MAESLKPRFEPRVNSLYINTRAARYGARYMLYTGPGGVPPGPLGLPPFRSEGRLRVENPRPQPPRRYYI